MNDSATRLVKRGLTCAEAMEYVGVKRRTFDEVWRPRLVGQQQGTRLIFDRQDLDRLFDEFKTAASGIATIAANDPVSAFPHNGPRNGWPNREKGRDTWAKKSEGYPRTKGVGRSTSGTSVPAFADAISQVMRKPKAG